MQYLQINGNKFRILEHVFVNIPDASTEFVMVKLLIKPWKEMMS